MTKDGIKKRIDELYERKREVREEYDREKAEYDH